MKKLSKLILSTFLGPFILIFLVVVFILLTVYMIKYFEDFVGKDLGFSVFAELIFYFSINMTPAALPLAILLSSLMTYGNLGEHFELIAIKASGISLLRTLSPVFVAVLVLTVLAFMNNNHIVPDANIKAYILLYDIRQKKPSLDIREGQFYNGLPNYSIKVGKKYPDEVSMKNIIIYDHTGEMGNNNITIADSCRMYSILDNRYLVFELYNGNTYSEQRQAGFKYAARYNSVNDLLRSEFSQMKMVLSLASFDMSRTKEELFAGNRLMKDMSELSRDADSMKNMIFDIRKKLLANAENMYEYQFKEHRLQQIDSMKTLAAEKREQQAGAAGELLKLRMDSLRNIKIPLRLKNASALKQETKESKEELPTSLSQSFQKDSLNATKPPPPTFDEYFSDQIKVAKVVSDALAKARYVKSELADELVRIKDLTHEINRHEVEKHKKVALACSCLIMFLIGAPLGSIIKKGGLGFPVIISIAFFIVFYIATIMGEKYSREDLLDNTLAAWLPNLVLLPFGILFLHHARNDSRLFDGDVYIIWWEKVSKMWKKRKNEEN